MQPVAPVVTFSGLAKVWETQPTAADGKSLNFKFPLDKLPEGEYNFQVTALNSGDLKAAFWQAPVMIIQ